MTVVVILTETMHAIARKEEKGDETKGEKREHSAVACNEKDATREVPDLDAAKEERRERSRMKAGRKQVVSRVRDVKVVRCEEIQINLRGTPGVRPASPF